MTRHVLRAFSLFPYFTNANANTDEKKRLQRLLFALKDGGRITNGSGSTMSATEWVVDILKDADIPPGFVGKQVTVVPVPSSSATSAPPDRTAWPMYDLALRMKESGLVANASPAVVRHKVVPKAHRTAAADRLSVADHLASITADIRGIPSNHSITLLDDVLSTGTSAMAVARALQIAGCPCAINILTATYTVGADYQRDGVPSARSNIVWLEGRKDRAWRPSGEVEYVDE